MKFFRLIASALLFLFAVVGAIASFRTPRYTYVNHRGYNVAAPENTLSAFRRSAEMGYRFVECDISFTKDGVPVLLHDNTVDRTSNGSGTVGSFTLEEIKKLDFGSWFSADFAGEQIPTLEEFLKLCKEKHLHPYLELKSAGTSVGQVKTAYDVVEALGMASDVTWISFSADLLFAVRDLDETARLGFLAERDASNVLSVCRSLRNGKNEVFADCSYKMTDLADLSKSLKKENFALEVWTVNDTAVLSDLPAGITRITTNRLK